MRSAKAEGDARPGIIRLDVVVSDSSGRPIGGLQRDDFEVLDGGQTRSIVSFRAYDENSDSPAEFIFLIDALNLSNQQTDRAQRAIEEFLERSGDGGHLRHPVMVYRLSSLGLSASSGPSMDAPAVVAELGRPLQERQLWREPIVPLGSPSNPSPEWVHNAASLKALGSIVIEERRRAGRKLLFWIGPGWPVESGGHYSFDEITELSTRLREARISLFGITAWPYRKHASGYDKDSRGVRGPKDARPGDMSLEAIASRSGGRMMAPALDLTGAIERCVENADRFYSLSFDPPRAERPDEYREVRVTVRGRDAVARTSAEYYNQPTFYDRAAGGDELVTVKRLQEVILSLRGQSDGEAYRRLCAVELSERLEEENLAAMELSLPGHRSKEALIAMADQSAFLAPPLAESPDAAPPDGKMQAAMVARMRDYLTRTIPELPNFFATRTTVRYVQAAPKDEKTAPNDQGLHAAATERATVLLRDRKEVTEASVPLERQGRGRERDLTTEGAFGPILALVLAGASDPQSKMKWSRWEQSAEGALAVYGFAIPGSTPLFGVGFCCLADPDGTIQFNVKAGFHGEVALDPESGALLRVVVEADIEPGLPMVRSGIEVEYGRVTLGGKVYICPIRSVSISRSRTVRLLHEWDETFGVYGPFETILNDVLFTDYHLFRADHWIMPEVSPAT